MSSRCEKTCAILRALSLVLSYCARVSTLLMSFLEREGVNLHLAMMARPMKVVPIIYNQGWEN